MDCEKSTATAASIEFGIDKKTMTKKEQEQKKHNISKFLTPTLLGSSLHSREFGFTVVDAPQQSKTKKKKKITIKHLQADIA